LSPLGLTIVFLLFDLRHDRPARVGGLLSRPCHFRHRHFGQFLQSEFRIGQDTDCRREIFADLP
jgi:hypothetical protein